MVTGQEATKMEAGRYAQDVIEDVLVKWGGTGKIEEKTINGHSIMQVTLIIPLKREMQK